MAIQTSGTTAIAISSAQVVTLTNPLAAGSGGTGLSSLGTGVATFLGTPSSANLAAALTDETGTGANVFAGSPTLTGTPLAPTAAPGTNTTQIATTAFVQNVAGALGTMSTQNANAVAITGGSITGITDLAVADGGTGASTFTANSVVLGNGTSSLAGNMIAPGTTGNVLTSNGTTWASSTPSIGVGGAGTSWHNVSKSAGTPYTNSRSYPIQVSVMSNLVNNGCSCELVVDGVRVSYFGIAGYVGTATVAGIVPAGSTYQINLVSMSINSWAELY
jgi:hypothetical protein